MFLHRFRRFLLPAGIVALVIGAAAPVIAQPANAATSAPVAVHAQRHVPTPKAPRSGKRVPHLTGAAFRNAARKATRQSGAARLAQIKTSPGISTASSGTIRPDLTSWSGTFHADWGTFPSVTIDGAYANQQLDSFTLPSGSGDTIYSPTLDPSSIDCIEVTTIYVGGADYIGAYDWCASSPGFAVLVSDQTSSFQADYTTDTDGRQFYTVEDVQTDASTNQWTAYLYNYSTGNWDTLYQSANTSKLSQSGGGWDMDEVYTDYDSTTLGGDYCNQTGGADWESTGLTYLIGGSWVAASSANATTSYPSGLDIGCAAAHFTAAGDAWDATPTGTHAAAAITGTGSGECLDVPDANFSEGQVVDISTCNGSSEQSWTYTSLGELTIDGGQYCLEVYESATANNSEVDIWACNDTQTQEWTWSTYNTLVGINSGLCLDDPGAATANGTAVVIYDCAGGATNEQWTWPSSSPSSSAVATSAASDVTATAATLNGTVNPEGAVTTYQFQYGTSTGYGSVAPASPASAGSGTSAVSESASLTGLSAGTTYDYRLVATNTTGTTDGANQTFTTPAAGSSGTAFTAVGGLIQGMSLMP